MEEAQKRTGRRAALGAAFLMAASAVGPGFLIQTTRFSAEGGLSFLYVILLVTLADIVTKANIWSVIGASGLSGAGIADRIRKGLGTVLTVLIAIGGLAFNTGNIGGATGVVYAPRTVETGYGYVDGTLYCHLNMGWSGSYDYWYALPAIPAGGYNFTVVNSITYNVFPDRTGEIVSGRVTDQSGTPLAGAEVNASVFYTSKSGGWFSSRLKTNVVSTVTAMTGPTGVYALYAPTNRTYSVLLSATYKGATTNAITTTTSTSVSPTSVNYETGNYTYSGSGLSIGNSWGNDFVITVKSKFNGIIFR